MDAQTAPAATPQEAPKTGPKTIGKASDLLKQQETPVNPEKAGTVGMGGEADQQAKPKTEEVTAAERLSKIAQERKRLDADREKFRQEQEQAKAARSEMEKDATSWRELHAAKTNGKVLDALRKLFSQEELDTKVHTELTRDILAREPGQPLTQAEVEAIVEAKAAAAREAEEKKSEEDRKAAETAEVERTTAAKTNYLKVVNDHFEADATQYPAISHYKVTGDEVMAFVESHWQQHEEVPEPKAILEHFEKQLRERHAGAKIPGLTPTTAAPLPTGVTPDWSAGATPRVQPAGKRKTPAELRADWERIKREHAGVAG